MRSCSTGFDSGAQLPVGGELDTAAPQTLASRTGPRSDSSPRVLIVEDDPQILDGVVLRLETSGYRTTIAHGIDDAARLLLADPPEAIVLDICVPNYDGMALLSWLSSAKLSETIPVVVLSTNLRDRRRSLQAGARFFLCKPYEGRRLVEAIHRAILDAQAASSRFPRIARHAEGLG